MKLKEIVAISGIGGLHKIIGRTKTGLILESLNETKKRFPTGIQDKVSVLEDISMYTLSGDMRLADVFVKLHEVGNVPTNKDDAKKQRQFLIDTIELDSERVYDSDIKKLLNWYHTLAGLIDFKEAAKEAEKEEVSSAEPEVKVEQVQEEAPAKTAKKTAKKASDSDTDETPKKTAAKKTAAKKTAAKKSTKSEE